MKVFIILITFFVSNVLCRRHHHYHNHLDNKTIHQNEGRNQKYTTIEASDMSQGYTPYSKHGPG